MKKSHAYIIFSIIALAVIILLFTGSNEKKKQFDERITLSKSDKIPYGSYIAFESLKYMFPEASVFSTKQSPGYWDSLSNHDSRQALIIVTPRFYADEFEMKKLVRFMEAGNDVFISTRHISSAAEEMIGSKSDPIHNSLIRDANGKLIMDSLELKLMLPPFAEDRNFSYKGAKFNAWFYDVDTAFADVLGTDEMNRKNFIHLRAGRGNLYLHLAPLAFSNYFLLQKDNISYYENMMSVIPSDTRKVVWDEYYINKKQYSSYSSSSSSDDDNNSEGRNSISELFRYPEVRAALLLAMAILLLYVLFEMRRKQRFIPVIAKPRNESLDFVKTIGRLYYDKGDHKNLCRKMAAYFLEHVRNKYKLPTGNLDEEFVKKLQFKTGVDEGELKPIIAFINRLDGKGSVNSRMVAEFHNKLEEFYKKST